MSTLSAILLISAALQASVVSAQEPVPANAYAADASLRLGPGDRVRITTYGDHDLSGEFIVGSDGQLSFPLLGDISVGGKTVSELQTQLTEALAKGYVRNPRVSAEVLSYRPYYILGEVNKPGKYPYTPQLTIYNAVATAEGFTYRANTHIVFLKHPQSDKEEKVRLDASTKVQPGDTIRIAERFF